MSKISTIFTNHVSSVSDAKTLLQELLQELPKETSEVRERLEACLPELEKSEKAEEEFQAGLRKEQRRREHERQHYIFTHGHEPDPRDDPDWKDR